MATLSAEYKKSSSELNSLTKVDDGLIFFDTDNETLKLKTSAGFIEYEQKRDPVYWIGYKNTTQSISNSTWTIVHTYSEESSSGTFTYPTGSNNALNYWCVPVDGVYSITWDLSSVLANMYTYVNVNSTTYAESGVVNYGYMNSSAERIASCTTIKLTSTDKVRLWVYTGAANCPKNADAEWRNDMALTLLYRT